MFLRADVETNSDKDAEEDEQNGTPNENIGDPLDSGGSASKFSPQYMNEEYLQEADMDLDSTESEELQSVASSAGRKVCTCVFLFQVDEVSENIASVVFFRDDNPIPQTRMMTSSTSSSSKHPCLKNDSRIKKPWTLVDLLLLEETVLKKS